MQTSRRERTYYSIGGGFVLDDDGSGRPGAHARPDTGAVPVPHRHRLLQHCTDNGLSISDVMLADECARRPEPEVRAGLLGIWRVMRRLHGRTAARPRACCRAG